MDILCERIHATVIFYFVLLHMDACPLCYGDLDIWKLLVNRDARIDLEEFDCIILVDR